MVIKKIDPLSAAKIGGLIYALIGLPSAVLIWVISLVGLNNAGLTNSPFGPGAGFVASAGAIAFVVLPLVYGVMGFFMSLAAAWIYNIFAGFVGGISVEVQMEAPIVSNR